MIVIYVIILSEFMRFFLEISMLPHEIYPLDCYSYNIFLFCFTKSVCLVSRFNTCNIV